MSHQQGCWPVLSPLYAFGLQGKNGRSTFLEFPLNYYTVSEGLVVDRISVKKIVVSNFLFQRFQTFYYLFFNCSLLKHREQP